MKNHTLFIRLPPRTLSSNGLLSASVEFCVVTSKDEIAIQGAERFSDLGHYVKSTQNLIVLVAAVDVNVIFAVIPPIGTRKLNLALPHLVDEYLLENAACSAMVLGHKKQVDSEGRRSISIMRQAWLDEIGAALASIGARNFQLIPSQSCLFTLGKQTSGALGVILEHEQGQEVIYSTGTGRQGGWVQALMAADATAQQCLDYLSLSEYQSVLLYVPPAFLNKLSVPDREDIAIKECTWPFWISAARMCVQTKSYDFSKKLKIDVDRAWIAAMWILLIGILLVNMALPTLDWWRLSRESEKISTSLLLSYQTMFPTEQGAGDLRAKMTGKLVHARRANGIPAPDDFLALSSAWAQAWSEAKSTMVNLPVPILVYEAGHFLAQMPEPMQDDTLFNNLQSAIKKHGLSLVKDGAERLRLEVLPEAR